MKLDEIVAWYQKKIGTYDKQQWEKTVEQKILDGFSSVTLKTAKLKTELIDVDLVRGSTFPKAKPKQTLLTVIRLAILRYLFLPIYAKWWVKQTSPNVFGILLMLYLTQMFNWAVYTYNVHRLAQMCEQPSDYARNNNQTHALVNYTLNSDTSTDTEKQPVEEHIVSLSELLIPMALSFLLSLIHSQIVATNTASGAKTKRRRFSNASQNGKREQRERKLRRRKKIVKTRNQQDDALQQQQQQRNKIHSSNEIIRKPKVNVPSVCSLNEAPIATTVSNVSFQLETFHSSTSIIRNANQAANYNAAKLKLDLNNKATSSAISVAANCSDEYLNDNRGINGSSSSSNVALKKRNVNWHSPEQNFDATTTQEKQQQTSPQSMSTSTTNSETKIDGTSSSSTTTTNNTNSSSSSKNVSVNGSPTKTVRIDDSVQEFYDDLIKRTDALPNKSDSIAADQARRCQSATNTLTLRRNIGDDDGFESLNGKSSSGEDNNTLLPTTSAKCQQRLGLNAGDFQCKNRAEHLKQHTTAENVLKTAAYRRRMPYSSESDYEQRARSASACDVYQQQTKKPQIVAVNASSDETDEDGDDAEIISSPASLGNASTYNECTTSATEWLGVTTNSEDCSYSSDLDEEFKNHNISDEDGCDLDFTPTTILNPHGTTDRISCAIWEQRDIKKAQMSVLEISSSIIERVESMPETNDYIYIGVCFSFLLSLIPSFCRLCEVTIDTDKSSEINYLDMPMLLWEKASFSFSTIFRFAFGSMRWERTVLTIGFMQRLCLSLILFIIFAVAERTFKHRFLYAKLFSHLTSSRRARKSNLPHFRLNKVRNIKTWLSVRSYLKKRGPQRSVDIIVSAAFIVTLLLLAFLSVEWLKDSVHLHSHLNLEALMWSTAIGIFLLRFMTLGNKIHHKYRSVSVLITEQINLYLQIEQKPKKKDELMVSNSVLKLAADLLKELETPFKISGLSANPYLFTTVKVVILSALSGVLSEMLGFKLKLHKIKIK